MNYSKQNNIMSVLSSESGLEMIRVTTAQNQNICQAALARILCDHFGFYDPKGRIQTAACEAGLGVLRRRGVIDLPTVPVSRKDRAAPLLPDQPVPEAVEVPEDLADIKGLKLTRVETEAQKRIWNDLMKREHPLGNGPLVGRQLRYLIASEHGWLGGFGFAAAALRLADRDSWLGWDETMLNDHLDRIINMSRFLIRPCVRTPNLASHLLGMVMRIVADDFEKCYGYRLWLAESFIATDHHAGTCYQAANWVKVGKTKGRGRYDRKHLANQGTKDIYLFPLHKDYACIRRSRRIPLEKLSVESELDSKQWAGAEFENAPLGDRRLSARVIKIATAAGQCPTASWPEIFEGDRHQLKAYYRFVDQPEDSAVTMENILHPHRERTLCRIADQKIVLCIQDSCDLNFDGLNETKGLGVLGKNQTETTSRGLRAHSTLSVSDQGLPLGILRSDLIAREPKPEHKKKDARYIPVEEKETYRWIEGLRDLQELAPAFDSTLLIGVMDREGDFFELFDAWRARPNVGLIIRAKHNRRTGESLSLFETVEASDVMARAEINVPRASARPKKGVKRREHRIAQVSLRWRQVELSPPRHGLSSRKKPVVVWMLQVKEENAPRGANPLEWRLLCSQRIETCEEAMKCLQRYTFRWRIEDWHRVLKSGCKIEKIQNDTATRLSRSIAINMVVAWRIMLLTLLGRECPELPPEVFFTDMEIKTLELYAQKKRLSGPINLNSAVRLVARLGGHLGRKSDRPPGHQVLWKGYATLSVMTQGVELVYQL